MTVLELSNNENFKAVNLADDSREILGAYCGDLLSWVMGKASADDAWITIMTNQNILAVASLIDVACIILTESVDLDNETLSLAQEKEINILKTNLTTYETAAFLSGKI